ncbi:MAG: phosphoribosyltransferase family protein [Armatimonadetes bacterium]|nr:phosphoribosyltransferase family protein [Armatimonadota bacterium]MDW8152791.1 phosphoribosyltransferase family protein [Armatimonadota bacterium]
MFRDRHHAGRALTAALRPRIAPEEDVLVLGIPRGGVVVAGEVAAQLGAELDIIVPRKLRAPQNPELAIGAVAEDGSLYLDERSLWALRVDQAYIDQEAAFQMVEIQRRLRAYRGDRPPPRVEGRTVILVDDGVATGSTMIAAVRSARSKKAGRVVVAVPVAPPESVHRLRQEADEVVCVHEDPYFMAVGQFYEDFRQVSDEEVRGILSEAWRRTEGGPHLHA